MLVPISWLKEFVDINATPQELAEKITMGGVEVEEIVRFKNDSVLNLAPTPNRGDCLSIMGVGREVAALYRKQFKEISYRPIKGKGKMKDWVKIVVNDKESCPRYTSRIVEGVKVGKSPGWLKDRVESVGFRSINNVVDVTNLVLMELGQPVHAFDLLNLRGSTLIIDRPKETLKLVALDEQEYIFTSNDILNLDAERAIGAAGIMGAENSGVQNDTTTLVLESAYFDPTTVRRTSGRTGLVSESSKRFEKGVDPNFVIEGLHRMTELIVDVAGGIPSDDWIDIYPKKILPAVIDLTLLEVNRLLGTELSEKTVIDILESVGCAVRTEKDGFEITVPSYRPDLTRSVDLIEEVARLYGYGNIKDSMPLTRVSSLVKPKAKEADNQIRETLTSLGFYEAITYSFTSKEQLDNFGGLKGAVKLANPLTTEMEYMRTTIVPALLTSLQHNINRQISDVKLFELNKVFLPCGKYLPEERLYLAGAMTGNLTSSQWSVKDRQIDFFDVKAALWSIFERLGVGLPDVKRSDKLIFLHPAESVEINFKNEIIGYCGRLHPKLEREYDFTASTYIFEIDFDIVKKSYLERNISYRPISRYPLVIRDVALLVNSSVTHKELLQSFNKYVSKIVKSVDLFDIYSGKGIPEGKKSMAYRISFGSDDHTLEDDEVDEAFKEIIEKVKNKIKAEIR